MLKCSQPLSAFKLRYCTARSLLLLVFRYTFHSFRRTLYPRPHNDFPFDYRSILLRLLGVLRAVCAVLGCRRDAS